MKPQDTANSATIRSRKWRAKRSHMVNKCFMLSPAAVEKLDALKKSIGVKSDRAAIERLLKAIDVSFFEAAEIETAFQAESGHPPKPRIERQREAERPEDPDNKFCVACIADHPTCNGCCELCTLFDSISEDFCPHATRCHMPFIPNGKSPDMICPNCDGYGCANCEDGWIN